MSRSMQLLGGMSAAEFLSDYWQRQPLLIRGAVPNYNAPLDAQELAGLALEAEVESRLVQGQATTGPWRLRHGPFEQADFLALPEQHWTLLVQAVDLWVPELRTLLAQFDFLPPWRLDDIMVSYATAGGSVGPHVDQYDVFLLQTEGQRRWQVGEHCAADAPLVADSDLRVLAEFSPTQEWLLDPGDMLYLPPGMSHWGIAQTSCMTFSIGFRAPSLADMLGDLAIELLAQGNDQRYSDPPLTPAMATEQVDSAFVVEAQRMLRALADDEALIADWFARYMTMPKYPELQTLTKEERNARIGELRYLNGDLRD